LLKNPEVNRPRRNYMPKKALLRVEFEAGAEKRE
jgi:hypothetical protein